MAKKRCITYKRSFCGNFSSEKNVNVLSARRQKTHLHQYKYLRITYFKNTHNITKIYEKIIKYQKENKITTIVFEKVRIGTKSYTKASDIYFSLA